MFPNASLSKSDFEILFIKEQVIWACRGIFQFFLEYLIHLRKQFNTEIVWVNNAQLATLPEQVYFVKLLYGHIILTAKF